MINTRMRIKGIKILGVKMMGRKVITKEIETTLQTYCRDCFISEAFKKDYGKNYAQRFCNTQCTIGGKLQQLGKSLSDEHVGETD
jgi:hypothetical protein